MKHISALFFLVLCLAPNAFADPRQDCFHRGDGDLALRINGCTQVIQRPQESAKNRASAYRNRGIAYSKKGDYNSAIADFTRAMELDPNEARDYANRGLAYGRKGEHDRSITDFTRAIELDPKRASVYVNRGNAYGRRGDHDRAFADATRAIELDPTIAMAYNNRGIVYSLRAEYDKAIADFIRAIELDPSSALAYGNRGRAYSLRGEYERSFADFAKAIQLDPKLASTYRYRGYAYIQKGEHDHAISDLTKAIELDPKNGLAYAARGSAYGAKGDYDRAFAEFAQAIRIDPSEAASYNAKAWAHYLRGEYDRAIADANTALKLRPTPSYYHTRGEAYRAKHQYEHALSNFNQAIALNAKYLMAFAGRGKTYEEMGDRAKAIADYGRALALPAVSKSHKDEQADIGKRLSTLNSILNSVPTGPKVTPPTAIAKTLDRRVALVIGNSKYATVGALRNPANDAKAVASALRRLGFATVIERFDLDLRTLVDTVKEFGELTGDADWAIIYYAGHGIEMDGISYIIPVDAKLVRDIHVLDETVPLHHLLARVEAARKLRLVVLDACRNNPFVAKMIRTGRVSRAIGRGLAAIEPAAGVLVAYAAKHGTVASDGNSIHSPFAEALLAYMEEPGLEINFVFRKARDHVLRITNGGQEPFLYGSLPGEPLFFVSAAR